MKYVIKFTAALGFVGLVLVACGGGDTSGSTEGGGAGDSKPAACNTGPDACSQCNDDKCCDELVACSDDKKCKALSDCFVACSKAGGDLHACNESCPNATDPATLAVYDKITSCVEASCREPCFCVSDGTTCGDCESSKCCAPFAACEEVRDCVELVECVGTCASGDATCANACGARFPDGVSPFNTLGSCLQTSCSSACASGG